MDNQVQQEARLLESMQVIHNEVRPTNNQGACVYKCVYMVRALCNPPGMYLVCVEKFYIDVKRRRVIELAIKH